MPGPAVTVSADERLLFLVETTKKKSHLQKGDGEKSSPAFASKGEEGTKHSFLTVTVFPAVGHISVPSLAVTPSRGIPPLI